MCFHSAWNDIRNHDVSASDDIMLAADCVLLKFLYVTPPSRFQHAAPSEVLVLRQASKVANLSNGSLASATFQCTAPGAVYRLAAAARTAGPSRPRQCWAAWCLLAALGSESTPVGRTAR